MEQNKIICSCQYGSHSGTFITSEELDIKNGKPLSKKGFWLLDEFAICEKFRLEFEQWDKNKGFVFCDCSKHEKCSFYKEKNKGV